MRVPAISGAPSRPRPPGRGAGLSAAPRGGDASPPRLGRGPPVTSLREERRGDRGIRVAAARGLLPPSWRAELGDPVSGAGVLRPTRRLDRGAGV